MKSIFFTGIGWFGAIIAICSAIMAVCSGTGLMAFFFWVLCILGLAMVAVWKFSPKGFWD